MLEIIETLYYLGYIPLTILLMIIIGWATPSEIIRDTFESKLTKVYYPNLTIFSIIFSTILSFFGVVLVIVDLVILKNGNLQGYSVISFGLMLLSLCYVTIQASDNTKYVNNIFEKLKLKIDITRFIENQDILEKKLYYSRIILLIGILILINGAIQLYSDIGQLRYLSVVSVGFAIMNFAGGFERYAINMINQSQILNKINQFS